MTFTCELNSSISSRCKKERDGSRSHNNNIKLELKGKNILNRTVGNSIDKIYYERIAVINLHEHKI